MDSAEQLITKNLINVQQIEERAKSANEITKANIIQYYTTLMQKKLDEFEQHKRVNNEKIEATKTNLQQKLQTIKRARQIRWKQHVDKLIQCKYFSECPLIYNDIRFVDGEIISSTNMITFMKPFPSKSLLRAHIYHNAINYYTDDTLVFRYSVNSYTLCHLLGAVGPKLYILANQAECNPFIIYYNIQSYTEKRIHTFENVNIASISSCVYRGGIAMCIGLKKINPYYLNTATEILEPLHSTGSNYVGLNKINQYYLNTATEKLEPLHSIGLPDFREGQQRKLVSIDNELYTFIATTDGARLSIEIFVRTDKFWINKHSGMIAGDSLRWVISGTDRLYIVVHNYIHYDLYSWKDNLNIVSRSVYIHAITHFENKIYALHDTDGCEYISIYDIHFGKWLVGEITSSTEKSIDMCYVETVE